MQKSSVVGLDPNEKVTIKVKDESTYLILLWPSWLFLLKFFAFVHITLLKWVQSTVSDSGSCNRNWIRTYLSVSERRSSAACFVTDCGGVHVSRSWEPASTRQCFFQRLWTQSLSLSWTIQSQRAQKQYRSCDISLYSTSSPLLLQIIQRNSLFHPITSASNTAFILLFIKDALN